MGLMNWIAEVLQFCMEVDIPFSYSKDLIDFLIAPGTLSLK